jgi:hypothetical protein
MKKILIFALLATTASLQASACSLDYFTAADVVKKVMARTRGWTFENYKVTCEKINRANATVIISGDAVVLNGISIAWSNVGLKDKRNNITSLAFSGSSTKTNSYASQDKAEDLLEESVNAGVYQLSVNLDKALARLDEARESVHK